jgi:hypothetical protein
MKGFRIHDKFQRGAYPLLYPRISVIRGQFLSVTFHFSALSRVDFFHKIIDGFRITTRTLVFMEGTAFRRGVERTSADQKLRLTRFRASARTPVNPVIGLHSFLFASTVAALLRLAGDFHAGRPRREMNFTF